jgi:molecular chaperone DnaJ
MSKDYYAILGVSKNASPEEIKKSFRRLAHEHHPDKGGDAQKFKDINEAYQILGDETKRKQYDQFGSAAFENGGMGGGAGGPFGGFGGFDPSGFNINMDEMGDLGDMFGSVFGFGGGGGRKQKRGSNIEVDVTISFLESVKGVEKTVRIYKHDACSVCDGSGAEKGSASTPARRVSAELMPPASVPPAIIWYSLSTLYSTDTNASRPAFRIRRSFGFR